MSPREHSVRVQDILDRINGVGTYPGIWVKGNISPAWIRVLVSKYEKEVPMISLPTLVVIAMGITIGLTTILWMTFWQLNIKLEEERESLRKDLRAEQERNRR